MHPWSTGTRKHEIIGPQCKQRRGKKQTSNTTHFKDTSVTIFFHNAFFPFCRALIKLIVDLFILLFSFFFCKFYTRCLVLCVCISSSLAPFLVSFLHILRYLIAVLQNNFQLALIRAKRFSRQCPLRVLAFYAVTTTAGILWL